MSVNLIIAAGLFDSPWTVAIFVLAGALINWLSKRRADQAAENQPPEPDSAGAPPPPAPNWEENLRRMFEDKSPEQPGPPVNPPPLLRRAPTQGQTPLPPVIKSVERTDLVPPTSDEGRSLEELPEPAVRRYELSSAAHAAQAREASQRLQRSRKTRPISISLRRAHAARQAYAASLVFGPPKGLEL